jgi:hypothetical protein
MANAAGHKQIELFHQHKTCVDREWPPRRITGPPQLTWAAVTPICDRYRFRRIVSEAMRYLNHMSRRVISSERKVEYRK